MSDKKKPDYQLRAIVILAINSVAWGVMAIFLLTHGCGTFQK
jgi:hypothetical protein